MTRYDQNCLFGRRRFVGEDEADDEGASRDQMEFR